MLRIADLLKNPLLAEAKVVAGKAGLHNVIEWSHIIDVPNVVGMVEPGTLIVTTGQGIPPTSSGQVRFIATLARAGIVGMIVSIGGEFFQQLPLPLIQAADQRDFPLITVPHTLRFLDITRIVHEYLVSYQYTLLKRSDHIHQTLTQIVLEGGGMQELAVALSTLVNRSCTIEDPQLNLLAHARSGEVDPAREESIEAGGTPPLIRQVVRESGLLEEMARTLKPVMVRAWPEHGMTKDRIAAPIVVERKIYGYVWLIAGDEPLTEADRQAIERAAIVAALIILKDVAVRQTEARLQADVITQLLSGQTESLTLRDKVKRLGLDLQQSQRVVLLSLPEAVLPSLSLADELSQVIRQLAPQHIIQPLGQLFILILPDGVQIEPLSKALLAFLPDLKIALGGSAAALVHLAQSYQEAKEALDVGLAMAPDLDIYEFNDLGFLHWLYHLPQAAREGNPYSQRIRVLAADEKAARAHLLQTLEVFLDSGGNAAETARLLHIHRNTLTYRLRQIENLCHVLLTNPEVRLNLQIALKAYRLQPEPSRYK